MHRRLRRWRVAEWNGTSLVHASPVVTRQEIYCQKKTPFQLVILSLPFVIRAINHYTINENARQPGAGCMEQ